MEKAHCFQSSKVLLNVGGHRFETSLRLPTRTLRPCSPGAMSSPPTATARTSSTATEGTFTTFSPVFETLGDSS